MEKSHQDILKVSGCGGGFIDFLIESDGLRLGFFEKPRRK